ncbi:hypothetical protein HanRHA438_Chr05g0233361 [Helianthus annuus]|nr:hypothetical protein HanHA89_Chr05g0198361 [Helianthus annuus]KAJ0919758.1 hypothetical protein HanRHA438_Chr05g0233361 [Helianthus annuus]
MFLLEVDEDDLSSEALIWRSGLLLLRHGRPFSASVATFAPLLRFSVFDG